jgi:hydrogenase large subunit
MANRIVVDPVTRIEGHLRLEVEVKDGKVVDAYSSGTMVRGFELILKGRDPRDAWAFTERACGVCTTVHALASVRAVENAVGITVPPNAELIRNLMFCAQYLQDHAVHFYHLHALDWVDVVSALKADPKKWKRSGPGTMIRSRNLAIETVAGSERKSGGFGRRAGFAANLVELRSRGM